MKIDAEIGDEKYKLEINRDGDRISATVDGREYELELSTPEPNVYLFKNEGKISEIFVSPGAVSGVHHTQINGHSIEVKLIDPKRLRGSGGGSEHGDGAAEIRTAMPGKVVRFLLETGSEVEKGDGVMVVEAMKMQNELKAPRAGIIKEFKVMEGATVSAGDVLAVIE